MTEEQMIILEGLIALENDEGFTQEEYDGLIYEPVYTDIKMNDQDSGRYPE